MLLKLRVLCQPLNVKAKGEQLQLENACTYHHGSGTHRIPPVNQWCHKKRVSRAETHRYDFHPCMFSHWHYEKTVVVEPDYSPSMLLQKIYM